MSLKFLHSVDVDVSEKYRVAGVKLRNAGNGLWICTLVPLALLSSLHHFPEWSELYRTTSFISIGLLLSSLCNILHKDVFSPDSNNIPFIQIGYILSSTVVSLFLLFSTDRGVIYCLSIAIVTSFVYHPVQESLLKCCQKSFTWGEACLISQSLILFLSSFVVNIILSFEKTPKSCGKIASVVLQTGYFAVLTTLTIAYCFQPIMSNLLVFTPILFACFFLSVMVIPCFIFKFNSLLWLWNLTTEKHSILLITSWAFCCLGAVFCLFLQTRQSKSASTATRKSFHFLILLVLVPGLVWKPCLIYVASGIGLALLLVIEMCRKLKFSHFSEALQHCFDAFKDEKDEGGIALTPLYLMVGCSAPIWIYPFSYSIPLPLPVLSGIFPVAIGDAAASMGGTWFGKHKWKGSNKTIEGSIFCFSSQLLVYILFIYFGIVESKYFLWVCVVFIVTSIIEAKTNQIDNLILPFITYILFMIVT